MTKNNYLSNKDLLYEISKFNETGTASETLGNMILTLAWQISNKHSFIRYDWEVKQDMVGLAVLTALKSLKNFDANKQKYPNPFAYLTQVIINAFKAHLKQQYKHINIKQECYNKMELIDESDSYKSIDYEYLKRWDEVE